MRALAAMSALALLVWTSPSSAITRKLSEQHPYIMDIAAGAESVMVFRLDSDPIPRCVWDFTDSLRFIHCYPILEMAPSPGKDWNKELGDLLGSVRMNSWNRDGCGYSPQAVVRFSDSVRTSNLVVFTGRCDSLKVGLLMIRTDRPLEYQEMAAGGGDSSTCSDTRFLMLHFVKPCPLNLSRPRFETNRPKEPLSTMTKRLSLSSKRIPFIPSLLG